MRKYISWKIKAILKTKLKAKNNVIVKNILELPVNS